MQIEHFSHYIMPREIWSFSQLQKLVDAVHQFGINFKILQQHVFHNKTPNQIRNAYYKLKTQQPELFNSIPKQKQVLQKYMEFAPMESKEASFDISYCDDMFM